jgi:hypothetical protein
VGAKNGEMQEGLWYLIQQSSSPSWGCSFNGDRGCSFARLHLASEIEGNATSWRPSSIQHPRPCVAWSVVCTGRCQIRTLIQFDAADTTGARAGLNYAEEEWGARRGAPRRPRRGGVPTATAHNRTPISPPPIIGLIPALVHFSPPWSSPVFAGSPPACEGHGELREMRRA